MITLQILCKCLQTGNIDLLEDNQLTEEYFVGYEDEYNFIVDHFNEYGNTPDKATFLSKFPDLELVQVEESDRYLVDSIREQYLYYQAVPIVQQVAKLLKTDANAAAEYMIQATKELHPNYNLGGVNIIAQAIDRYNEFVERKQNQNEWFFTTGFPELDDIIHGIQRGEELFVIFARTNQGKSWILEKICTHIWQIGYNVGYISPEMGANSIGFRFDTLYKQIDNRGLMWGNGDVNEVEYKAYIDELAKKENAFIVATPNDFDKRITITKLRNWIKKYKLDAVAIDGITYLSDERGKRGDNKTTSLTNISEDLMSLSMEMKVPILTVVQANRGGVVDKDSQDLPELDTVRDSDGISHNASIVLALRQTKDNDLLIQIQKGRIASVGKKLAYHWKANIGEFINAPINDEQTTIRRREKTPKQEKEAKKEDVF